MRSCERCIFDLNGDITRTFKKNDFLFFEGDDVNTIYSIKEGLIKLEKVQEDGETRIIDIVTKGDYVALLTIINQTDEYKVTATALTDVTVTPITKKDANHAYQENLHFKETCLKCAANRLGVFQGHTFNSSTLDPKKKIISTLQHLSQKFGYVQGNDTIVKLPINKTELANMCGLRRETLSRKLSQLQKEGLLEVEKNIYKLIGV